MKRNKLMRTAMAAALMAGLSVPASAEVLIQCPGDTQGNDGVSDVPGIECMHLSAGDGYVTMADGKPLYIFSFGDITGVNKQQAMNAGMLGAAAPAPLIVLDENDEFYLNVTNVGMMVRPDLFDPHTVHWHGFPEAASVFDGVPDSSISINMGSTLTYYYNVVEPGTYMYHCHVEATEHMQMGMLGNLYVRPAQDGTSYTYGGRTYSTFAYNDGDGSTGYDVAVPLQLGSFDGAFHDASETVQPLPFALMRDNYPLINGRGYPDTVNPGSLPAPAENGGVFSQNESALVEATAGERVLLRISNLNVTRFYTLGALGVPMHVVGKDAKLLRGPDGKDLSYTTNSVTVGPGESYDAILDTAGMAPGTYFLYSTALNFLSNDSEDFGGMMTEIRIN